MHIHIDDSICFSDWFIQVFVYGNNIYYMDTIESVPVQLTDTGEEGNIFNGVPDWVYEGMSDLEIHFEGEKNRVRVNFEVQIQILFTTEYSFSFFKSAIPISAVYKYYMFRGKIWHNTFLRY